MNAVGTIFYSQVIRVFIRAVRQLADSLVRGKKKGALQGASRIYSSNLSYSIVLLIMKGGYTIGLSNFDFSVPGMKYASNDGILHSFKI